MKIKSIISAIILAMTIATVSPGISAFAAEQNSKKILSEDVPQLNEKDFEDIQLPEITDEAFNIAMEIAESDLEEKAALSKDGHYVNHYSNAKQAGVSQAAFDEFEKQLQLANENIDAGNLKAGKTMMEVELNPAAIKDHQFKEKSKKGEITAQFYTTTYWWGQRLSVSATEAYKIQKVLAAGGGVATLASLFGVGLVWAAVFVFLYGVGEICNWNNRGYYLYRTWTNQMWCKAK